MAEAFYSELLEGQLDVLRFGLIALVVLFIVFCVIFIVLNLRYYLSIRKYLKSNRHYRNRK